MLLTFGEGITYLCLVLMVLDLTPTAILLWQLPKPQGMQASYVPTLVDRAHHFAQHHVEWQRSGQAIMSFASNF